MGFSGFGSHFLFLKRVSKINFKLITEKMHKLKKTKEKMHSVKWALKVEHQSETTAVGFDAYLNNFLLFATFLNIHQLNYLSSQGT